MSATRNQYILLDHENVPSFDFGPLDGPHVKVLFFIGEKTAKIPIAAVESFLRHSGQVELIRISGNGRNALDFHIAFYAGRIAAQDPQASLHIVTKDHGFDPLIAHLKARHTRISRHETFDATKPAPSPVELTSAECTKRAVEFLAKNRPRKLQTLKTALQTHLGPQAKPSQITQVISELTKQNFIVVLDTGAVTYSV